MIKEAAYVLIRIFSLFEGCLRDDEKSEQS